MKVSVSKKAKKSIRFNDIFETEMCADGVLKALSFFKKHKLIVSATPKFWKIVNKLKRSDESTAELILSELMEYAKNVRLIIEPSIFSKKILDDPDFAQQAFIMFHELSLKEKSKIESNVIKLFADDIDVMAKNALEIRLGIITSSLNECVERQRRLLNEHTMLSAAIKSGDVARFFEAPTLEELITSDTLSRSTKLNVAHKFIEAVVAHTSTKKKKNSK